MRKPRWRRKNSANTVQIMPPISPSPPAFTPCVLRRSCPAGRPRTVPLQFTKSTSTNPSRLWQKRYDLVLPMSGTSSRTSIPFVRLQVTVNSSAAKIELRHGSNKA